MTEVLTIQIGQFSNFLGSHYWNQQQEQWNNEAEESTAYKRVFLEQYSQQSKPEYSPRLVVVDAPGFFGGNILGQVTEDLRLEKHSSISHAISTDSQKEDVAFSFYPKPYLHPFYLALNQVSNSRLNSSLNSLDLVSNVKFFTDYCIPQLSLDKNIATFNPVLDITLEEGNAFWDDYTNKLRKQLEHIDNLDCLNFSVDWMSPFCKVGLSTLEWLHEEIAKPALMISAWNPPKSSTEDLESPDARKEILVRSIESCTLVSNCLNTFSSYRVLMLSDYGHLKTNDILYQVAAVPALALECLTGPFFSLSSSMIRNSILQMSPLVKHFFQCVPVDQVNSLTPSYRSVWEIQSSYQPNKTSLDVHLSRPNLFTFGVLRRIEQKQTDVWRAHFRRTDELVTLNKEVSLNIAFPTQQINVTSLQHQIASVSCLSAQTLADNCLSSGVNAIRCAYFQNKIPYDFFDKSSVCELLQSLTQYSERQQEMTHELV